MSPAAIVRIFNGSDSFMTQSARVIYKLFMDELPKFTAFDNLLNPVYASEYLLHLENAETITADWVIKSTQVGMTEKVQDVMDIARAKYMEVKYFVQKAFPESAATQIEFGVDDYTKARRNQLKLANFLNNLNVACNKYKTELIAAGFSQARIDEILPVRAELMKKNSGQKTFQKQRPKLTEDRIIALNTCYTYMMSIMTAAQFVYANDYAKQNEFVYLPKKIMKNVEL